MLDEKLLTRLELIEARLDVRIIQSQRFMEDDDFITSSAFKGFLYKVKHKKLALTIKEREDRENTRELVRRLFDYDPESEEMKVVEARKLVQRSGMILTLGWDLEQGCMLYQVRRKDKAISYEVYGEDGLTRGSCFNIDAKTLAIWSISPEINKPKLMDVQSTP